MNLYESLTVPLGLPALSQTIFSGDRVFLVPDAEYAKESATLTEIVTILIQSGLQTEDITVLLTDADENSAAPKLCQCLPKEVRIQIHRPSRRDQLALLGVNSHDEPIMLHRELIDADMIISIGRFYLKHPKNHFGIHSAIFPRFSDAATLHRFAEMSGTQQHKLDNEVEEVARLLGIIFTIQFLKERGKPIQIAAGLPELVAETLRKH